MSRRRLAYHAKVGAFSLLLSFIFFVWLNGDAERPITDTALAYASLVLLSVTLILGPLSMLAPQLLQKLMPMRREIGVWSFLLALAHVILVFHTHKWNVLRFFFTPTDGGGWVINLASWGIGNYLGLAALVIAAVLAATSNDWSFRVLGVISWKHLQQLNYTLFALSAFHTLVYLPVMKRPYTFWAVFWFLATITVAFQTMGFIKTVRKMKRLG